MPRKSAAAPSLYSVHPSIAYGQAILRNLEERTGKSCDEWVKIARKHGATDKKVLVEWLKKEHGHGMNTAYWIAEQALGFDDETNPEVYLANAPKYVEAMYAGPKAALRPIHDALVELGRSMGDDVKICPCQTIVPLYRNHVIAEIKPSTRTRIDFGYALGDMKPTGRLVDTGGFQKKNRITHRIPITDVNEINAEVKKWLRVAYDRDA